MMHRNTKPFSFNKKYKDSIVDFVVTSGYILEESEKDPNCDSDHDNIYIADDYENAIPLTQEIPGLFFDTYEEGERALAKYLKGLTQNFEAIIKHRDELLKKYPESEI